MRSGGPCGCPWVGSWVQPHHPCPYAMGELPKRPTRVSLWGVRPTQPSDSLRSLRVRSRGSQLHLLCCHRFSYVLQIQSFDGILPEKKLLHLATTCHRIGFDELEVAG